MTAAEFHRLSAACLASRRLTPHGNPWFGSEIISLEDQLKTGLKARLPEENEFLEEVARLVETGKLPRKLVDSTFMWAVRRRQTYPLPAFERALRMQAERLGVEL